MVTWVLSKIDSAEVFGNYERGCQEFLIVCMEWLPALRLLESWGAEFIAYQIDGTARQWWRTYKDTRSQEAALPVTWVEFRKAFMTRFVPKSFRDRR